MDGRVQLAAGWRLCSTPPGQCADPGALAAGARDWIAAEVPSTVASALRAAGRWSLDGPAIDFDASDWWYALDFEGGGELADARAIVFEGLATLAEAWLDGKPILAADNMHLEHRCALAGLAPGRHELRIRFRSLAGALQERRPRPRWRAPMVAHQQLRWFRTTLLGRTPGWSPPAAAVGPWRAISIETARAAGAAPDVHAWLADGSGHLQVRVPWGAPAPRDALLHASRDGKRWSAPLEPGADGDLAGALLVPQAAPWWPHTHGEPALYSLEVEYTDASGARGTRQLGRTGFRSLALEAADGAFRLQVNGVPVFCRGACWTPLDPVSLAAPRTVLEAALRQLRDAGMNMVRVGGTMVYEQEQFHELCDELGILVWQDFMFANMDYPGDDAAFASSVEREARQVLERARRHPSLALLCGNSEVEQQAAMWGAPRAHWSPPLFHEVLARVAAVQAPAVPYWPSSAHGGDFPHAADAGSSSYYGVGAYLKPVTDARRAAPRFASECLAIANVPERATLEFVPGDGALRVHHPAWKQRVPRDLGAGWDFDDVRDHYFRELTGLDPLQVRYADHERYLQLGRIVSGEIMRAAYAEFRRRGSGCGGALVWFLRDLWAGAGWGIVDAAGRPKAPWHYLRRILQPIALWITDEGSNGLALHWANEPGEPLAARLEVSLYRHGAQRIAAAARELALPARSQGQLGIGALFDHFHDLSYAYRFGPPPVDVVHARLLAGDGATVAECFHPVLGLAGLLASDAGLSASARRTAPGTVELTVAATRYAHAVHVDAGSWSCSDQYFPIAPGGRAVVVLAAPTAARSTAFSCSIGALNCPAAINVSLAP